MAPFDAIPEPAPTEAAGGAGSEAQRASSSKRFALKLNSPGTLLALVLVLGFGQSLALLVFFGGRGDDLSAPHATTATAVPQEHADASADPHDAAHATEGAGDAPSNHDQPDAAAGATSAHEPAPASDHATDAEPVVEPRPVPTRVPDVLDTARDMLDRGDVSGARRIATAYLLRVDGMNSVARERASAAYAILGDSMRLDYELSLRLRGDGE